MAKKKETKSGLTSAAGLMRYYEADKLNAYYGVWP